MARRKKPAAQATPSEDAAAASSMDEPTTPPREPIAEVFELVAATASDTEIQNIVNRHIAHVIEKHTVAANYRILFLYDDIAIGRTDADRIYRTLSQGPADRPILLIVTSPGGDVAAAYLIAKLCREYAKGNFEVAVPRQAKSAATLIACGADRIHMGSLSELGPIDPQLGNIPALALKNSVEHLATLAKQYPEASEMFASYLAKSLRVEALGFYERVAESAVQYAIRLLDKRLNRGPRAPSDIASTLVYDYKDHGFVLDAVESQDIFGKEIVVLNTPEYELGNAVYNALTLCEWIVEWRFSRNVAFTGDSGGGCQLRRKKQD